MAELIQFNKKTWEAEFTQAENEKAIKELENGNILYFPKLGFSLKDTETCILSDKQSKKNQKNISLNPSSMKISGVKKTEKINDYINFMHRYANFAEKFIHSILPKYKTDIKIGRTSYRPIEAKGRKTNSISDDTRLHVDAFPATPVQDMRILRIFTNLNPTDRNRVWETGEPFNTVVNQFAQKINTLPLPGSHFLFQLFGITKTHRSLYDHYMLKLHNSMKLDTIYQQKVNKTKTAFPPNSTWLVFTDIVSHAVLSGQYLLEQTFYVPIKAMNDLSISPQSILEKKLNRPILR